MNGWNTVLKKRDDDPWSETDFGYMRNPSGVAKVSALKITKHVMISNGSRVQLKMEFGQKDSAQKQGVLTAKFNAYIYRVLKQVHPCMGLAKPANEILNSLNFEIFHRLANEAMKLCANDGKSTLDDGHICAAIGLCIPGELAKHAKSEATKAVMKWSASQGGGGGGASKNSKMRRCNISQSARAGLQFPVARVAKAMNVGKYASRIGGKAPVALTAVMEYLMAEVLELSGNAASDAKKRRIAPNAIVCAIQKDDELKQMISVVVN